MNKRSKVGRLAQAYFFTKARVEGEAGLLEILGQGCCEFFGWLPDGKGFCHPAEDVCKTDWWLAWNQQLLSMCEPFRVQHRNVFEGILGGFQLS
jgi:hypothetical protein